MVNAWSEAASQAAPDVVLNNLTVSYRQHPALHHISGCLPRGSLTAVVGPNGAGKSTLLKSIAGLLPIEGGAAGGALRVAVPQAQRAYLPQAAELDRSFPIHVQDCVLMGCWGRTGPWGRVDDVARQRIAQALHSVGLAGFEARSVGSLSSGQLQRVMFARLVVQDAQLILLDEPFNAVDARTTADLLALVRTWHEQQRTVLVVLHDDALVHQHFPQTLLLARELVAWGPTAQVLNQAHWQRACAMAEAWDDTAAPCSRTTGPLQTVQAAQP